MLLGRMSKVTAPWTDDQVRLLNGYQQCGIFHPFTGSHGVALIATRDGWVETLGGEICQDWAHDFMVDGSWQESVDSVRKLESRSTGR